MQDNLSRLELATGQTLEVAYQGMYQTLNYAPKNQKFTTVEWVKYMKDELSALEFATGLEVASW